MKLNMIERCNIRMEIPISDTITDNVKNGEIRMIREILVRLIIFFFFWGFLMEQKINFER